MNNIRLTDTAIKKLRAPAKGRVEYFDTSLSGFMLRVTDKGAKSFAVMTRIRKNGQARQIRVTVGRYPDISVEKAREKARDAKRDAKQGIDPRPAKRAAELDANSIQSLFYGDTNRRVRGYLDSLKVDRRPRTVAEVERIFRHDILPAVTGDDPRQWKDRPIRSIEKRDVIEMLDRKTDTPLMHNRVLAWLRAFFGWAEARGVVDAPPSFRKLAKGEKARDRVPGFDPVTEEQDHGELRAIWRCAGESPFGLLVRFLLVTGKRRSEAAELQDMEIDLEAARWRVPAERAKNGAPDLVPLSDLAIEILVAAQAERKRQAETLEREPGPFVFSTTAGDKPFAGFSKGKAALDRAIAEWWRVNMAGRNQMAPWRLHDLRRTIASYIRELGYSRDVADAVLGHKLGGVSGVYIRNPMTEQKTTALAAWADKLGAIVEDQPDNNAASVADSRA